MKIADIDYNDKDVWKLYHNGYTKGLFQLESYLGRHWAKQVKPNNIGELAALISIIRPGTLQAKIDDKSVSQHYVDRKHGKEAVDFDHPSLEGILGDTYGLLLYQENIMLMSRKLAGFDGVQADKLRKAIGKKKADLMEKVRKDFLTGCEKARIIDNQKAGQMFDNVAKSARYLFNKSHGVAYAFNSYWSAYFKHYFPKEFFVAYLEFANEKPDPYQEIKELISEARIFGYEFALPNIDKFAPRFNAKESDTIYFGIKDVKGLTSKNGDKTIEVIKESGVNGKTTYLETLLFVGTKINATCFKALAAIGFFNNVTRTEALYQYEIFKSLTAAEVKWLVNNYDQKKWATLKHALVDLAPTKKEGGGTSKEQRKQKILNEIKMLADPPYPMTDDPGWIVDQEEKLLGCPVSISMIDLSNKASVGNSTCKDLLEGKRGKNLRLAATISAMKVHKITKSGQNQGREMAFITLEDGTCLYDNTVMFPEAYEEYRLSLDEGANVLLQGATQKNGSFSIEKVYEI